MGLRDLPAILAGHAYDTGQQRQEPSGSAGEGGGGIPTTSLVAVLLIALVTVAVLVWISPGARARARSLAPLALLAGVVLTPLIAWTVASSSSSEEDRAPLLVDRAKGLKGEPELLVSLTDETLNTLPMTGGRRAVRVICVDRDRQVVLDDRQRWPFIDERGYDYPHVHQAASTEELGRVERCVLHGTRTRLAADVKGALR